MDKNSFLIYLDYEEQFELLTDEQVGQLIRAIMKYEKNREIPKLEGVLKMAFSFIRAQLDRDREKWQGEKRKRSEAGKKGMQNRWKNKSKNNNDNNVTDVNNKINSDNNVKNVITRNNKNN